MNQKLRSFIFLIFCICQFSIQVVDAGEIKKPWTVLVYLNADNSLEDYGFEDLREMEKIGSNQQVNVVVQFDPVSPSGTQRLYITKAIEPESRDSHAFQSRVVEKMDEQDMGDPDVLVDFVTWGMRTYPADHYMVILWNHGSGWDKDSEKLPVIKGISYDDTSRSHISTNQLADAVDQITSNTGNRIDILGFDACLMSMFEVIDSLAGMVDYVVGSEHTEPGDGYPYDDFLNIFKGSRTPSPLELAKHLVNVYGKSYASDGSQSKAEGARGAYDRDDKWSWGSQEVTLSAVDLSRIELVKRRLAKWVQVVDQSENISKAAHIKAIRETTSFAESSYKDLGHYVKNVLNQVSAEEANSLANKGSDSGVVGASLALIRAIQSAVVANFVTSRFESATGISIYLPYSSYSSPWSDKSIVSKMDSYKSLKWAKTSEWTKHLEYILKKEATVSVPVSEENSVEEPPESIEVIPLSRN